MGEVGLRQVRDGGRVLRFRASVLGAATSQRGSAPRWSELVVYRLEDGSYLISKIGRSVVAHRPDCFRVNHRMQPWSQARHTEEFLGPRAGCRDCRPNLAHGISDDTVVEVTRYRAMYAENAESVAAALEDPLAAATLPMPKLVRDVLSQCAASDPNFAAYAEAVMAEPSALEKTTRTP